MEEVALWSAPTCSRELHQDIEKQSRLPSWEAGGERKQKGCWSRHAASAVVLSSPRCLHESTNAPEKRKEAAADLHMCALLPKMLLSSAQDAIIHKQPFTSLHNPTCYSQTLPAPPFCHLIQSNATSIFSCIIPLVLLVFHPLIQQEKTRLTCFTHMLHSCSLSISVLF